MNRGWAVLGSVGLHVAAFAAAGTIAVRTPPVTPRPPDRPSVSMSFVERLPETPRVTTQLRGPTEAEIAPPPRPSAQRPRPVVSAPRPVVSAPRPVVSGAAAPSTPGASNPGPATGPLSTGLILGGIARPGVVRPPPVALQAVPATPCSEPPTRPRPRDRPREITYDLDARQRRVQGSLTLAVHVDASGGVESVDLEGSVDDAVDQAAVEAVRTWRFEPATECGRPARGTYRLVRHFQPED